MTQPQRLDIENLTCRYGDVTALDSVSFAVDASEFISVLGPSGCGKSTLLRAIAGLEPVAGGSIRIGGRSVEGLRPKDRQIAFVFQSYALYPHMTCRANLATPLMMSELSTTGRTPLLHRLSPRSRHQRADIAARVAAMAEQLEITPYLDRRPSGLSGGQRQRVALGRALIREPALFLLDEPLANLDAALRNRTRSELRALQKRIGATTLFVTHDQTEAMAISDRVVVMFDGRIRQIGTPDQLYRAPADLEVARFLSQPYLNCVDTALIRWALGDRTRNGAVRIGGRPVDETDGVVTFRPEHARVERLDASAHPGLHCVVEHAEHGGVDAHLFVRLKASGDRCVVRIKSEEMAAWQSGSDASLYFDHAVAQIFPRSSGTTSSRNARQPTPEALAA